MVAIALCFGFWAWRGQEVALVDAPGPRVPCVSYAPFRGGESPFDETLVIGPERIEADLRTLSALTGCVRIYSVDHGLEQVPGIAERLGLTVLLGAWLGRDPERNARELTAVVALANRYPATIRAVIVGNEVLLRREMPAERLMEHIRSVAAAVDVPVSYADVWEFWLKHPEVSAAVDLLTVHILPYWEDRPVAVETAVRHVGDVVAVMRRAFPGKSLLIGEVGWPSRGRMREQALPSPLNQARFVREVLAMAKREGLALNLMEGIDQPWKRRLEGTVGGFWGVLDEQRRTKFSLAGPVSDEPEWPCLLAASAGVALLPILWAAVRGLKRHPLVWLALTLAAPAASISLMLALLDVRVASETPFDWVVGIARVAISAASLALTARILFPGAPIALPAPAFGLIERLRAGRVRGMGNIADALGWLRLLTIFGIATTALCLAFDGRYRDFPTDAFAPAAFCFLVLAWRGRGRARTEGGAREEAMLAGIAAAAGGAVLAAEGLGNYQALAWAGIVFVAATIPVLELWPLKPDGAQGREKNGGGAQLSVVENEAGRARRSSGHDSGPA